MLNSKLSTFFINIRFNQTAVLAFIIFALLLSLSCGKRKPPLPPVEKVRQRAEISGFQRGSKVLLSWQMPARNAADGSILTIKSADVYRLAESADAPLSLSEEEFASRSIIIGNLPISDADFALKKLTFTDNLEFAGQSARLRYAIRFVNDSGQKAAFSNFLLIEPAAKIADSPNDLKAAVSQDFVSLEWTAPQSNIDGTKPVNLLGYNIYRSASKTEAAKLLNENPVSDSQFKDEFFEFDKEYFYFTRAVSVGKAGEPLESLESNIVEIKPKDTFPPSAPAAITIAAVPQSISIFFATNPEKDIAGYSIYRSTDESLEKSKWTLLNSDLVKTNTFQDSSVQSGTKYFYYLTATDLKGNVSESSEIVSEIVP